MNIFLAFIENPQGTFFKKLNFSFLFVFEKHPYFSEDLIMVQNELIIAPQFSVKGPFTEIQKWDLNFFSAW